MEFDFDFTISNISRQTAELILSIVTAIVEAAGGELGGGLVETKGEGDSDESQNA